MSHFSACMFYACAGQWWMDLSHSAGVPAVRSGARPRGRARLPPLTATTCVRARPSQAKSIFVSDLHLTTGTKSQKVNHRKGKHLV